MQAFTIFDSVSDLTHPIRAAPYVHPFLLERGSALVGGGGEVGRRTDGRRRRARGLRLERERLCAVMTALPTIVVVDSSRAPDEQKRTQVTVFSPQQGSSQKGTSTSLCGRSKGPAASKSGRRAAAREPPQQHHHQTATSAAAAMPKGGGSARKVKAGTTAKAATSKKANIKKTEKRGQRSTSSRRGSDEAAEDGRKEAKQSLSSHHSITRQACPRDQGDR